MLLLMGGQLAYLYFVGPISMEDGRPMTRPDIPLLGFLITVLLIAGSLIIAAILQRKPLPIRYVAINKEPQTKLSNDIGEKPDTQQYRPIYPGQFSKNTGEIYKIKILIHLCVNVVGLINTRVGYANIKKNVNYIILAIVRDQMSFL